MNGKSSVHVSVTLGDVDKSVCNDQLINPHGPNDEVARRRGNGFLIVACVMKLGGSLEQPSCSSLAESRFVFAVVALAHALEIDVISECVDSSEQLERLQAAGCDELQARCAVSA